MPIDVKECHDDEFQRIADEVAKTLRQKNHDYGDSFQKVYNNFGDLSTFIRLSDKLGRLETAVQGTEYQVRDESIDDVYKDIAGYCILTLKARNEQRGTTR